MIEETGRIVATDGGFAWIEARSRKDCARCARGEGCGGGLIGRWLGNRLHRVRARDPQGFPVGTMVRIAVSERAILMAALLVYLIPLLGLLAGALAGHLLSGGHDPVAATGGLSGLVGVLVWVRSRLGRGMLARYFEPEVSGELKGECGVAEIHA